jgi:hypothetical protein
MPGAQLCNRPRVLLGSMLVNRPGVLLIRVSSPEVACVCDWVGLLSKMQAHPCTHNHYRETIWCLPATRHPRPTYVHGALLCNRRLEPEARGYAHSKICSPEVFCASDRVGLAVKDPPAPCGALRNVRQPPHTDVLVETCRSTSLASCVRCHEMYHIPKCHGTGVMTS